MKTNKNQIKIDMEDLKIMHKSSWDIEHRSAVLGQNTVSEFDGVTDQ